MPEITQKQLHAVVHGRVQGVGFRSFVYHCALNLEVTGWVRNTSEGDVEVTAEGDENNLQALLGNLYEGPRGAWVANVESDWKAPTEAYDHFYVAPTD
jgi:acylphosphatase